MAANSKLLQIFRPTNARCRVLFHLRVITKYGAALGWLADEGFLRRVRDKALVDCVPNVFPSFFSSLSGAWKPLDHLYRILGSIIDRIASCSTWETMISVKDSFNAPWG